MNKFAKGLSLLSSASLLAGCNTAHLKYSLKEVHKNIDGLIDNGVEMDLSVSNFTMMEEEGNFSGDLHFGAKEQTFWATYEGEGEEATKEGYGVKVIEGGYAQYKYNAETEEFDFEQKLEDKEEYDSVKRMIYFALGYANTVQGLLTDAGEGEVAGRACHVYGFAFNNVLNFFGSEADINIYVDDETGITLKAQHEIYVATADDTEFTFEVKALVTEGVVTPVFNDPEELPDEGGDNTGPLEEVDA